jgi:Ca2+-binding EF-hand superfamily protein
MFITSRMNIEKVKLKILLRNEDDRQFVVDNLQQQIKIYSDFVPIGERNAEHAKSHSPTKQTMKKSKSAPDRLQAEEVDEDEFGSDDEAKFKKGSVSLKSATSEKKSKLINDDIRKIVGKYLKLKFRELDSTKSGFISEDSIPEYIESLELVKMGFTDEEEEGVKSWIGADYDGLLSLDGALAELTDMMMSAIDSQRHTSGDNNGLIIQLMTASVTNADGAVSPTKSKINWKSKSFSTDDPSPTIPPDLEKYLRDSFEAYDLDKNGVLDEVEFFELITVLNLGLEEADIVALKVIINIE